MKRNVLMFVLMGMSLLLGWSVGFAYASLNRVSVLYLSVALIMAIGAGLTRRTRVVALMTALFGMATTVILAVISYDQARQATGYMVDRMSWVFWIILINTILFAIYGDTQTTAKMRTRDL